jgi:integrase
MSSIRDRSGKLVFDFTYQGIRCRETSRLLDTQGNRKVANDILKRIDAEIIVGTFCYETYFPKSKKVNLFSEIQTRKVSGNKEELPTLAEFSATWLEENSGAWRPTYLYKLNGMFNKYILPSFGGRKLDSISKSDFLLFRNELVAYRKSNGKPMTSYNINKIMLKLKAVLTEASERFGIDNVGATVKALKNQAVELLPLSLNEVQQFLSLIRDDYHCYFTTRFFTGLRSSEITGLRWKDMYIEGGYLMVRAALVNGELIDTKTVGSYRKIELNEYVLDCLKKHKENTLFNNELDFVFCTGEGKHVNNNNICARVWHPMLRLLKLAPRKMYQTRHTTATLWLASGESPEWIARQMGHSSTALLFSTYSQFVAHNTQRDGARFDSFLLQSNLKDRAKKL